MAALHQVRVVADDEVPGCEVAVEGGDHLAGRMTRREDVAGYVRSRHHDLAVGVEQAEPEVPHQRKHVGLRRVEDLLSRLVEQAFETVPHHGERGGIESGFAGTCAGRRGRRAGAGHNRVSHVAHPFLMVV